VRSLSAALVATAALAGCAGSSDERLSREEFVEQATAICDRAEQRIGELDAPASVDDLEAYAREARSITEEGLDDLEALEPPQELEDGFDRYLDQGNDVVEVLEELEQAAASGDEAEAQQLAGELAESADAQQAARDAGLPGCEDEGDG
jgi:hypothetical protein